MKKITAALILAVAAIVHLDAQPTPIRQFFDRFTADWIRGNANQAASARFFTGAEQRNLERQLTPLTADWTNERRDLARRGLAELARFDRAALSDADRLSADLMQWQLQIIVDGERYDDYAFPFEQFSGANVNLVSTLTISHPLQNESDAENYLERLQQVSRRMDEALAEARRIAAKDLIPPRFILRLTIDQMKQFVDQPVSQNPFVSTFGAKLGSISSMSASQVESLSRRAETTVASQIYPAWQRTIAFLESLVPRSNDDAGLWRLPDGAGAYAYFLKRYTSTDYTADQIHEIGLKRVAEIESEMDGIMRSLGRTTGSVKERIEQLKKDQAYPVTEDGRTQIMAEANSILRDAEVRATTLFDHRPKAAVAVQPFPKFLEANAAANYTAPPQDASRPGIIQIPLRPDRMTKFGLRSLIYHEGVPGHHFQIALNRETTDQPRFRQLSAFGGIPAFTEGWGLYAERLAAEANWYDGDPIGRLGQLDQELFRARRLVVDTGLHAKHWTRQQAIDYGIEASEVERYVVYPGQACAYMLGQLKWLELKDRARQRLGDRFSFKDYHNFVLALGTMPLSMLDREVDHYIATRP
jgi:uncharacterized protein (DUF885 family)